MAGLVVDLALAQMTARPRQTFVSILGVATGVAFFIAIAGLMLGFQTFIIEQLVESSPHITISDEFRDAGVQPAESLAAGAVEVRRVLPRDPARGIRDAKRMLDALSAEPGVAVSPALRGQLILRRAGRDYPVSTFGIDPNREGQVTSVGRDMVAGRLIDLAAALDGLIIGSALAQMMGVTIGDVVVAAAPTGATARFRIVGLFKTGLDNFDTGIAYANLTRVQALLNRPQVVNQIRLKLDDVTQSIPFAARIEARFGYKTQPWEETNKRVLSVFDFQLIVIFATVSAIMLVAGFGIFNIISTIVLEKARDIAILRAIGLDRVDIARMFLIQGILVGLAGTLIGWALGQAMVAAMSTLPAPGAADPSQTLRMRAGWELHLASGGLAMIAALLAAWLPARKAARAEPLTVIRGAA